MHKFHAVNTLSVTIVSVIRIARTPHARHRAPTETSVPSYQSKSLKCKYVVFVGAKQTRAHTVPHKHYPSTIILFVHIYIIICMQVIFAKEHGQRCRTASQWHQVEFNFYAQNIIPSVCCCADKQTLDKHRFSHSLCMPFMPSCLLSFAYPCRAPLRYARGGFLY